MKLDNFRLADKTTNETQRASESVVIYMVICFNTKDESKISERLSKLRKASPIISSVDFFKIISNIKCVKAKIKKIQWII